MERWQSIWENQVEFNLSESGVHPLKLGEILTDPTVLSDQRLGYTQTNGTEELRKTIAAIYPNANSDNILVTNGSAEANFAVMWSFLNRGAEIVVMLPNYMQVWGLAKTLQAKLKLFWLRESQSEWVPDLRSLKRIVSRKTKLIAVCNPNNPTGAIMKGEQVEEICKIAKRVGAWILSDEVYHGAELDGEETPSFWNQYERVIVTNGLSKAYGLPGLRIGWAVAPSDLIAKLWAYHDYTTICPSALSDYFARLALAENVRPKILARTLQILRENLPIVKNWVEGHKGCLSFITPKAGAIALVKYSLGIGSSELAERLVKEKSTLVVPGDHFHIGKYVRIGYGSTGEYLKEGLKRISEFINTIQACTKD
jgi:aspartate/methionine/tyrosine aminotransferase